MTPGIRTVLRLPARKLWIATTSILLACSPSTQPPTTAATPSPSSTTTAAATPAPSSIGSASVVASSAPPAPSAAPAPAPTPAKIDSLAVIRGATFLAEKGGEGVRFEQSPTYEGWSILRFKGKKAPPAKPNYGWSLLDHGNGHISARLPLGSPNKKNFEELDIFVGADDNLELTGLDWNSAKFRRAP